MKKTIIIKYILISLGIFAVAVCVSILTRMLLLHDTQMGSFSNEQASVVASMVEGAVAAVAAGFVLYEMKVNGKVHERENDIEEAQFLLQYNQSFIQDEKMIEVECMLEKWMENPSDCSINLISDDNRQLFINYLVYLEGLAPLIFRGILKLEHIDDLMAYRFFLAMNNPELQKDQIFRFADYYRGCIKLYRVWYKYRNDKGLPILLEEYSLDKWDQYQYYQLDVNVRYCNKSDPLNRVSALIYDTDPYIYPAAFGNKRNAQKYLPSFIKANTIFNYKNILVAIQDNEIIGVSVIVTDNYSSNEEIQSVHCNTNSFSDVNENYFTRIPSMVQNDQIYVMCICVDKRNQGKGVGAALLNQIVKEYGDHDIALDVLKENEKAIRLYRKFGFEITSCKTGYSKSDIKPECYQMIRKKQARNV